MQVLIEPTQDAQVADVNISNDRFVSLAYNSDAEVIDIELFVTQTPEAIKPAIQLTSSTNYIQIGGPATYRIIKPATTNVVGVYVEK